MPKQSLKVSSFHNGLNSKVDPRDIKDDELAVLSDVSVDDIGRITMSGKQSAAITIDDSNKPALGELEDGYGLFRFGSDYSSSGSEVRTNYIIVWDDQVGKFYWVYNSAAGGALNTWATPSHLDLSTDWGTSEDAVPVYYYVDGALRVADSNYVNTANVPMWIGNVNRTLFPSGNTLALSGWKREKQELEAPADARISISAPADGSNNIIPVGSVYWHVSNLTPENSIYTFTDTMSHYSNNNYPYNMTEYYGSDSNDESWATTYYGTGGYGGSSFHSFGIAFFEEDDDNSITWTYETGGSYNFNDSGTTKTFGTGESIYLAVRLPGEESKNVWLGTHKSPHSGGNWYSIGITDAYITFYNAGKTEFTKYWIDFTQFTDVTTPSATWHILEFPFDDTFEATVTGNPATFLPQKISLEITYSWTRAGAVSTGADANTNKGLDIIHFSDMRIDEAGLVGVNTVGKQKFLMSYTYDDTENESLLFEPASPEIDLANTTSAYKIGITAYPSDPTNNRITGSNLYLEDEGIPYRIAELRYLKGIRGAWESEFPTSAQFTEFATSPKVTNKSSLIKTDGLPLLESYEAMNGFSPSVITLSSKYKTAVVMNRQVYIGNIYQDGKTYGDRMIKTTTNSFDVFPTEGREIDVVANDGDDIIKLEAYADRILQFKRNAMYLINATRSAEYLEDTFIGKGVTNDSAVCKTDMGIAWANENGCYFYDGQKVHNLIDGKIKETDWQTHIGDSTDIIFFPLKKKILVTSGSGNIYTFSFITTSWSYSKSKVDATKTNFVADIDNDIKFMSGAGLVKKWDDSTSSGDVQILTKDFDFGNPSVRKKCFKFYVTYKSSAATNIKVYYGTNGKNLQTVDVSLLTDLSTTVGDGDTFNDNPKVLQVATATIEVDDVVSGNAKIPSNSKVTEIISSSLLRINNDVTDNATDEAVTYSTKGREVSTTSTFSGTSTNCYTVDGLVTTGGEWKQAELLPPSAINNIYSIQLHFISDGTTPASFEINDLTIIYREKPLK